MAELLDTDLAISHLAPKAFFKHEEIVELQRAIFAEKKRTPEISSIK
jgi:hypothetical protein